MGKCTHHPDRETGYICMKHNIFLCDECIECRDPDLYCKFRPSCPIYFISKKGFKEPQTEPVQKKEFIRAEFPPLTDANLLAGVKLT